MSTRPLDYIPSIVALVNEQAEDVGLWFLAATASEAYLQQELRRLHAVIEAAFVEANQSGGGDVA